MDRYKKKMTSGTLHLATVGPTLCNCWTSGSGIFFWVDLVLSCFLLWLVLTATFIHIMKQVRSPWVLLEQPRGSWMFKCSWMAALFTVHTLAVVSTYLCYWEARLQKRWWHRNKKRTTWSPESQTGHGNHLNILNAPKVHVWGLLFLPLGTPIFFVGYVRSIFKIRSL